MDAEEGREKKRVNLADDPSNRAMVQMDLHLLPREILLDILSRLPITSLIHFKTTSHAGYDLIADPRLPSMFRNCRVRNSNPCLLLFDYKFRASQPWQLHFVDSEDFSGRVTKIDPPHHSEVNYLVGSCSGLLCLSLFGGSSESDRLLIYNPFVGDAVRVPPANRFRNQSEVFGFGFHRRTGEFKVVRIAWGERILMLVDPALDVEEVDDESMVQVFTVGTTEWRKKGAPPPQLRREIGPQALVEGSLLWVTDVGMGGVGLVFGIISFELADEVFQEIPPPRCQRFVLRGYRLSSLNGCLSAATLVDALHFDIWVMMQYGVKESWVKQYSFDPNFPGGWPSCLTMYSTVICVLKNGEILLHNVAGFPVSYDPVENRLKTLQISGLPNSFQAIPFFPSLVSAKATMNLQL